MYHVMYFAFARREKRAEVPNATARRDEGIHSWQDTVRILRLQPVSRREGLIRGRLGLQWCSSGEH